MTRSVDLRQSINHAFTLKMVNLTQKNQQEQTK